MKERDDPGWRAGSVLDQGENGGYIHGLGRKERGGFRIERSDSQAQMDVCKRFGATPMAAPSGLKVGISRSVKERGVKPLHALRHPPEGDTTGWYVWSGELSADPTFFEALCVEHLNAQCPELVAYLAMPPGWRVLLAPNFEDVWFDSSLLDT